MADEDLSLDISEGEGGGGKKKLIIIILAAVLLIGGGAAAFLLMGSEESGETEQTGETTAEPETAEPVVAVEPIFMTLKPPFTVNFSGRKTRYLQLKIAVMSMKQTVIDAVTHHAPVISNNLLLIIGSQSIKTLQTTKGKEDLRQLLLEEIRKVVKENADMEGVENIYYTGFVMQ